MTGTRLALARMHRGMTRKELATCVNVSPRAVTGFERGEISPSEETVEKLAEALAFPVSFFGLPEAEIPSASSVSFKRRRKISRVVRDKALAYTTFCTDAASRTARNAHVPPDSDVPDLSDMTPVEAALILRSLWGLGDQPVIDLHRLLKDHGVLCFALRKDLAGVGSYSLWTQDRTRPVVLLDVRADQYDVLEDLASELGHLCLHQRTDFSVDTRELAYEVASFAQELLMPREGFTQSVENIKGDGSFELLSDYWHVPPHEILKRTKTLGLISNQRYRQLQKAISAR